MTCRPPTPPCTGYALSGTAQVAEASAYQGDALLSQNISLYGQDTWKITPRFTMTYGLRWDVNPPLEGRKLGERSIHHRGAE